MEKLQECLPGVFRFVAGIPEKLSPTSQRYFQMGKKEDFSTLPSPGKFPFDAERIVCCPSKRGFRVTLPLGENEDVYGLGLQLKSLCQTGKKRVLRVNSDPVTDTGDSHAPVPLLFTTGGWGVFFDTARYLNIYCGCTSLLRSGPSDSAEKDASIKLNESELYSSNRHGRSIEAEIPSEDGIVIYFFAGPAMIDAVRRYILFCGGGCLPPEWGLGLHYRTCGTADCSDVLKMADFLREHEIPCDVLGLEPGWQTHAYSCSLRWSDERFPEPENFTEKLHARHFKINLWEHVFLHESSPLYSALKPYSGDTLVWEGLVPDLAKKEAAELFTEYHRKNFTARNIDAFKLDECDNSDFSRSPWSFPEWSNFPSGCDGEVMHSLLGMLYQKCILDSCSAAGKRTYGNVRSAHALAPSMPFVLYSDLYDAHDFLRGVTACGFSGLLWTPELRHAVSAEDYLRRMEAMILAPQFLMNIWSMPYPPWKQLDKQKNRDGIFLDTAEQDMLEKATRGIVRERMSFIPYLTEAFASYKFEGMPPFRALVMDFPNDPRMRCLDRAWLAGKDLIAAPLTAGENELALPLPPGIWRDYRTGESFEGEVLLRPAQDLLPVLVREGSVIPSAVPKQHAGGKTELILRCYGKAPRPARLYADPGDGAIPSKEFFGEVSPDGHMDEILRRNYDIADTLIFS